MAENVISRDDEGPVSRPRARPLMVGGRYGLFEQIGSGGMARVYLGRLFGSGGFTRVVAIKRMHRQLAREIEFVTMFRDEVRLTSRILHPNVVQTLDVVEETGELFLVMEYVHGESLARLMRQLVERGQTIPPVVASSIICGVLHGLHAAHEARSENDEPLGIVHRDVSPQNILVGCDGVARVLDFGIARGAGRQHLTREGQIRGKMAYLTPEILKGREVDRRADIYSVSVVLWEALTGARLFQAPNDAVVLAKVLSGEVVPLRSVAPHLTEGLEAIVMKGLDRDPDKRFSSAREMALALQQEVGVLAPCEIGDWVGDLAEQTLAERSRQVIEMERSSGIYPHEGWSSALAAPSETSEFTAPTMAAQGLARAEAAGLDEPASSPSASRTPRAPRARKALYQSLPFRIGVVVLALGVCAIVFAKPISRSLRFGRTRVPAKMSAPAITPPIAATTTPTLAATIGWIGSPAAEPPAEIPAPTPAPGAPAAEPRPSAAKKAPVRHRNVARPRRPTKEEASTDEANSDGF